MAQTASAEPSLCVLVPHFKDEYWLSVAHGIEGRAQERGLHVHFFEAGGYQAREQQIRDLDACRDMGADAILLGAVTSDHPDLLAAVARIAADRPVIGLVNALDAPKLAARIGVDWREMGLLLGQRLAELHPPGSPPQRAILLTGPEESGWVSLLEGGLEAGLANSAVTIAAVYRADTGASEQLRLLERALAVEALPDLIIGDGPAIEAAMALFAEPGVDGPALAATYVTHNVARGLLGGRIVAVPYDDPQAQGALAVDAAVGALSGLRRPEMAGPPIRVLASPSDARQIQLSPPGYFPALE